MSADIDVTPTHRRRWRWWTEPGFALDEWRALESLADDLDRASEHVKRVGQGLQGWMPGGTRISGMASTLARMSIRWEHRAAKAKEDAIRDEANTGAFKDGGAHDWIERQEIKISEEKAVTVMARALNELEAAERLLMDSTQLSGSDH